MPFLVEGISSQSKLSIFGNRAGSRIAYQSSPTQATSDKSITAYVCNASLYLRYCALRVDGAVRQSRVRALPPFTDLSLI